jgi:dihydrofolate reductase
MGKVIAAAVMSLDGYIAKHDNTIGRLFDWYMNGDVECPTASPDITFQEHPGAPLTFVTDGVQAAVEQARAIAGDRVVAVTAGTIARQCLELGLLGDPTVCIQGEQVTHLVFPVRR